ncbi:hypothetical protein ACFVWY_34075 [Streptomyces sp. NPDC058195]|uniref:hypothetical protein n=1 Tax=Streptomyces sp. NPDC058195 TaxID=3346375 RepID=UPI0036E5DCBC
MRIRTALAALTLATAGLLGAAGAASAQEGLDASWGQGQFFVNQNGAGVQGAQSSAAADGVSNAGFWIMADDSGVSGSYNGSGATWNNE